MSISKLLRTKTADLHLASEQALDVAGIREGSLSLMSYTRMVLAHYQVWSAVAYWLPAATSTRDREFVTGMLNALGADLELLGEEVPPKMNFIHKDKGEASLLGVLYVLRGSTLGGTMINRKLHVCPELGRLGSFNFHNACSTLGSRHWPEFLKELDANVTDKDSREEALAAARSVFSLYLD